MTITQSPPDVDSAGNPYHGYFRVKAWSVDCEGYTQAIEQVWRFEHGEVTQIIPEHATQQ